MSVTDRQWKFQMLLQDEVKVVSKLVVSAIIEFICIRHFSLQNQTTQGKNSYPTITYIVYFNVIDS